MRKALVVPSLVLALAGCSAGGERSSSTLPPTPSALSSGRHIQTIPGGGTLYGTTNSGTVIAVPLGSSGPTTAVRTVVPHPNHPAYVQGIATLADGKLAILQAYTPSGGLQQSRIVVENANADGAAPAQNIFCDPQHNNTPAAIARNALGGFDVLYTNNDVQQLFVRRFSADGAGVVNTLPLSIGTDVLATNSAGHDELGSSQGELVKYLPTATDSTASFADVQLGGVGYWTGAVAPDHTLYVVHGDHPNQTIVAIVKNAIARTIGPFPNSYLNGVAVDSTGQLYASMSPSDISGTATVLVFPTDANGTSAPSRTITLTGMNFIGGLAISE